MRLARVTLFGLAMLASNARADAVVSLDEVETVRRFAIEDGLPQSSVTSIVQTRDEYLWLGTYGGLVRFDGANFRVFRNLVGQGPSSDRITALAEDHDARLWIGTDDAGISVFANGRFEWLPVCAGRCRVFELLHLDSAVIAATDEGVFAIDPATRRARQVTDRRLAFGAVAAGEAYVADVDRLWRIEAGGLQPVPLPNSLGRIGLVQAVGDELWVAGNDTIYRRARSAWHPFVPGHPWPAVSLLVKDALGQVWVSDTHGQTVRIASDGAVVTTSLPAGTLLSGLAASDGSLWMGSSAQGLWRVRPSRAALLDDPAFGFKLPGLAVTGDGDGLWFGLNCDGLRHRDGQGRVRAWPRLGLLDAQCPWSLQRAPSGRLWIGTTDGKLGFLDGVDAEIRPAHAWGTTEIVRSIHAISDRELLVAVGENTTHVTVADDGHVIDIAPIEALRGMRILRMVPARSGGIWFVGDQGVVRLVDDKLAERVDVASGLTTRFVRALHEEADGTLLLGTYGGGLNVVRGGRVIRVHSEATGLHDDVISCIVEDRAGGLWLAGNRGLALISLAERARLATASTVEVRPLGRSDGLIPEETNGGVDPACHRDGEGRLWFALMSGFAAITPHAMPSARLPAASPPIIEAVSLAGRAVDPRGVVHVQRDDQNLRIEVAVVSLGVPEATRLRFRLSTDAEWVELGAGRRVVYPQIPLGEYDVEIVARTADRDWSAPARVRIVNPRPWYQHPASWVIALLIVVAATLLLERGVKLYLRRRNARYLAAVRIRSAELERHNQALEEEARTDALTGISNRRHFMAALAAAWTDDACHPLSVLVIDVDDFKKYNDAFGHLRGDACLRQVGQILRANVRDTTLVARYGGEEFVVLLRGAGPQQALGLAERLLKVINAAAIPQAETAHHRVVTFSIGCATADPARDASPEACLERADAALYDAKRRGRNAVSVAADPARLGTPRA